MPMFVIWMAIPRTATAQTEVIETEPMETASQAAFHAESNSIPVAANACSKNFALASRRR